MIHFFIFYFSPPTPHHPPTCTGFPIYPGSNAQIYILLIANSRIMVKIFRNKSFLIFAHNPPSSWEICGIIIPVPPSMLHTAFTSHHESLRTRSSRVPNCSDCTSSSYLITWTFNFVWLLAGWLAGWMFNIIIQSHNIWVNLSSPSPHTKPT